jgi:hypothetical protein
MLTLKDYMTQQNLEHIALLMVESFELTIGKKLTKDEIDYVIHTTRFTFDNYAVLFEKIDAGFSEQKGKEKVEELIATFMKRLTKLMTHYIFARTETYMLRKELETLRGQ